MDTLEISEKLKQAGVAEPQAKAITSAIQKGAQESKAYTDESQEGLVTKYDFRAGLAELKAELRAAENRQLWRTIVIMVAMTAIFSYISKGF